MSPFYLVLYIFIALIVVLCVVSFAMYMCHVCSGVCGDNSDFDANGIVYLEERQPLSNTEGSNINDDDDPERVTCNVREFARKYEENLNNIDIQSDCEIGGIGAGERTLSNSECSLKLDSHSNMTNMRASQNTLYKKKYHAPPIPPKPAVPVMIHSQPSSKKSSIVDPPPYGSVMSNQSTPYKSSPCSTPDRLTPSTDSPSRSINAPTRKPPPPPPPPKPLGLSDEFLAALPPPRDSMLPPPDLPLLRDSVLPPPPPVDNYLSDDSFHPVTDNYLSDCD